MQVSEGPDTFEFRSPHGMKAARSRLRTFADIAVRHLQHFNHPGRAWHDLSGPQDTLTVVLAEVRGRCEARTNLHRNRKISSKLWCISSAAVIFSPLVLFASCNDLSLELSDHSSSWHFSQKYLEGT